MNNKIEWPLWVNAPASVVDQHRIDIQSSYVTHILLHDAKAGKYFLLATNNEAASLEITLSLSKLPTDLKSLDARDEHRKQTVRLQRSGPQQFTLRDKLPPYGVAFYVLS